MPRGVYDRKAAKEKRRQEAKVKDEEVYAKDEESPMPILTSRELVITFRVIVTSHGIPSLPSVQQCCRTTEEVIRHCLTSDEGTVIGPNLKGPIAIQLAGPVTAEEF